ncbi:hypothetical protein MAH1_16700 [Sessilibacter sp. MAH1]
MFIRILATVFIVALTACANVHSSETTPQQHFTTLRSDASIKHTLDSKQDEMIAIYHEVRKNDPQLAVKMFIHIIITPDGEVDSVYPTRKEITGGSLDSVDEFEEKLMAYLAELKFEKLSAPQRGYNYSIQFAGY